ncbi:hypothetical protein KYB31_22200 [Clostridium felsineum]|uniref:hypothetical protein n=1 Tax=Clostridium felsineum TaxID=36839 RepID=UPI00098C0E8B|nr:hypothetical protein [Clostridium felsineum]MCR3761687.1 hypothetical protein [Clostridium felsineum]URZ04358.1 hypothetical protein CLAUR_044470 [Clostridium felsineum]
MKKAIYIAIDMVLNIICILIFIEGIRIGNEAKAPFLNDYDNISGPLKIGAVLFVFGKSIFKSYFKVKNNNRGWVSEKSLSARKVFGIMFIVVSLLLIFGAWAQNDELQDNLKDYYGGKTVNDIVVITGLDFDKPKGSKNKIISAVHAKSIKNNKKIDFYDNIYSEYEFYIGETYKIKYLPTTNRILSVKKEGNDIMNKGDGSE